MMNTEKCDAMYAVCSTASFPRFAAIAVRPAQ
jgi:hypothetical protein